MRRRLPVAPTTLQRSVWMLLVQREAKPTWLLLITFIGGRAAFVALARRQLTFRTTPLRLPGGRILTSPVLSLDGKKIAFVESTATSSIFHVLTWATDAG